MHRERNTVYTVKTSNIYSRKQLIEKDKKSHNLMNVSSAHRTKDEEDHPCGRQVWLTFLSVSALIWIIVSFQNFVPKPLLLFLHLKLVRVLTTWSSSCGNYVLYASAGVSDEESWRSKIYIGIQKVCCVSVIEGESSYFYPIKMNKDVVIASVSYGLGYGYFQSFLTQSPSADIYCSQLPWIRLFEGPPLPFWTCS